MITLPEESDNTARVVGIDPGSQYLGVAYIEYDIATGAIVSSSAKTLHADKLSSKKDWVVNLHGDRVARILALKTALGNYLNEVNPVKVGCESPFYNPRRPNAYGVLVEVLTTIRMAVMDWSQWLGLELIDPPTVKKAVGASGGAKKEEVLAKVIALTGELHLAQSSDTLDEHSVDALAVAYHCYKTIMKEREVKV